MSFLPERTILGQLEIIEVYDFYDKPVLFSCKNKSGLIFIVLCVDSYVILSPVVDKEKHEYELLSLKLPKNSENI